MLRSRIAKVLKTLSYREREIIKLRYGLGDGYSYTLEEVGHIFKVTRERIRQIEAKAVRKLQQPSRSQELVGFLLDSRWRGVFSQRREYLSRLRFRSHRRSRKRFFLRSLLTVLPRSARLDPLRRALVVGSSVGRADEQGTPVQIRGGPAAVTEEVGRPILFGHCRAQVTARRPGQPELGSQKTYQRVTCGPRRGREAAKKVGIVGDRF